MRTEPLVPKALRWSLGALVSTTLGAALAGCAKVPLVGGPPKADLRIVAGADLNDCGKGAAPLTYRIVQTTDASAMTGTTLAQVWGREDKLLGAAFVARSQDAVDPGATREIQVELDPKTKAVVVIGNFCRTNEACWYQVQPRKGSGGVKLRLSADASCLKPARR